MTLREANDEARRLFGPGATCESSRTGRRVSIPRPKGATGRLTVTFMQGTDWRVAFERLSLFKIDDTPEGT